MNTFPMIRLEVSGMKHTIQMALMEHAAQMDADVQKAVEDYCTPENIQRVVRDATRQTLDGIIKEEVRKFFLYGEGREAVAEAVKAKLLNRTTFTPLDEV